MLVPKEDKWGHLLIIWFSRVPSLAQKKTILCPFDWRSCEMLILLINKCMCKSSTKQNSDYEKHKNMQRWLVFLKTSQLCPSFGTRQGLGMHYFRNLPLCAFCSYFAFSIQATIRSTGPEQLAICPNNLGLHSVENSSLGGLHAAYTIHTHSLAERCSTFVNAFWFIFFFPVRRNSVIA